MKAAAKWVEKNRPMVLGSLALALGLAWGFLTPAVRADDIDEKLYKVYGQKIMKDLQSHGYQNVAVLKFQVKKPSAGKPSLMVGRLNTGMATRLENALILEADDRQPIGITRGASQHATRKNPKASFQSEAGLKNLFALKYPLAWGNKEVRVDAFLTGIVEISRDFKEARVIVQAYDRKNTAKPREITQFKAKTDRGILSDINQNFVITKRSLKKATRDGVTTDEELNNEAANDAANNLPTNNKGSNNQNTNNKGSNNKGSNNKGSNNQNTPQNQSNLGSLARVREYLDFKIMVNNQEVQVGMDDRIPPPAERQEVTFLVKNLKPFPIGLVLRINGLNTLNNERDNRSPDAYSLWVLKPATDNANRTKDGYLVIRGFYPTLQTRHPIVAMPEAEIQNESQLGEDVSRHGFIQFDILEPLDREEPGVQIRERKVVSFRGVTKRGISLASLKKQVQKSIYQKEKPRTMLVPDPNARDANLRQEVFQGSWVVGCSIGYQGGTENIGNNNPGNNNPGNNNPGNNNPGNNNPGNNNPGNNNPGNNNPGNNNPGNNNPGNNNPGNNNGN